MCFNFTQHTTACASQGLVYVHVGKAGGGTVNIGLKALCKAGFVREYIQVHECNNALSTRTLSERTASGRSAVSARCTYSRLGGPVVASNWSSRCACDGGRCCEVPQGRCSEFPTPVLARGDAIATVVGSAPIVLWVRDPVARFAACWSAHVNIDRASLSERKKRVRASQLDAFFNETRSTVQQRSPALGAALSVTELRAADLETWLTRCAAALDSPLSALDAMFSHVRHARTGIAHYMGGMAGLERVRGQLLFVGTTEHFEESWAGLEAALAHAYGGCGRLRLPALTHMHDSYSKARERRPLSARSVRLLRGYFAGDLACIVGLVEWGLLAHEYAVEVGAAEPRAAEVVAGARTRRTEYLYEELAIPATQLDDGKDNGRLAARHHTSSGGIVIRR